MSAIAARPDRDRSDAPIVAAAVALGCTALALRSISSSSIAATALVGALGRVLPAPRGHARRAPVARWAAVTAGGVAAFLAGRALAAPVGIRLDRLGVVAVVVAAVAQEAFFRRLVYAWILPRGAGAAIVGSAALFALVHVPLYGAGVLPVDLAAGLVLGWQRWASGTWSSAAVTHVVANLVQAG